MNDLRHTGRRLQSYRYRLSLMVMIIFGCIGSCYYDNEETLYPGACIVENITFQGYVKPFININCTCHIKGSVNGNVSLDEYINCKPYISSGLFMKTIKHEQGVFAMPPAAPVRTSCEISKLEAWIKAGALNN